LSVFSYTGYLTYTGGYLFASGSTLLKIDVSTTPDTSSTFTALSNMGQAIVGDGTNLWVSAPNGSGSVIYEVPLSGGAASTFTSASDNSLRSTAIESAGSDLYVVVNGYGLRRYAKSDGSWVNVAGAGSGFAEGTGMDAWFSSTVTGIGSDGTNLWVADSGNHRLREVSAGTALSSAQPAAYSTTLALPYAGYIRTVAGSGTHATTDGTGTAAAFKQVWGAAVAGGYGYVSSEGAIRKVNLATGVVTTLAGNATTDGCVQSSDPTQVRFQTGSFMVTDGHFLYEAGTTAGCSTTAMLRTSLATGATSVVATGIGSPLHTLTIGPDNALYYSVFNAATIYRIDPLSGVITTVATTTNDIGGLTADSNYLWATTFTGSTSQLVRVTTGGSVTTILNDTTDTNLDLNYTASAGDYIYGSVTSGSGSLLGQITKSTGAERFVVGSSAGAYMDGTGTDGWMGTGPGLVSDGTDLWMADQAAYRFREVMPVSGPISLGPTNAARFSNKTNCGDPVSTDDGNFFDCVTDLAIPGRGPALSLHRTYNSLWASHDSPFGYGWTDDYNMSLVNDPYTANAKDVIQEDGSQTVFALSGSTYTTDSGTFATLVHNGSGTWTFTRRSRQIFTFNSSGQLTSIADLNGNTTTLTYSSGRLSTVTDPSSRTLSFSYNTAGRVSSVTDSASRTVSYGYNTSGNLTSVTDVGSGVTSFTYDTNHLLLTITDPRGHVVTTNVYDTGRRVTSQTDALSHATTFAYGLDGTVTITDPLGNVTVQQYNQTNGNLTSQTAGYGTTSAATTSYTYDPTTNGVASMTDPRGHTTNYTYDANGNLLTVTDPLSHTTTYTYDSLNDPLTVTDPLSHTTTYTYDSDGNPLTASRLLSGSTYRTTTYTYGDSSNPGMVTSITDPRGKVTSYAYDSHGNLTQVTDPDGNVTKYGYDTAGRRTSMIAPSGNITGASPSQWTTTYAYNAFGELTSVTDPLSHVTSYTYDADGNRSSMTDPDSNTTNYTYDNANRLTTITRADTTTLANSYDADGNLTGQTDGASHTTSYSYDPLNRVASVTDPLSHTTNYGYDPNGNQTTLTNPSSGVTTDTYDNANRLTGISYDDGTTPNVTYSYDAAGRRTSMVDGTGTTSYSYDALDRLTSDTNGNGATIGYAYDLDGNLTSLTYPDSSVVTYGYDDASQMNSLTDGLSNTSTFGYDNNGNLTGESLANGTTITRSYDRADEPATITHANSGGTFASFSYTLDNAGQVSAVSQTGVPGSSSPSYTYNSLNQLATDGGNSYSYDNADNLTATPTGTTLAYNAANELCWTASTTSTCGSPPTGATTYSYDNRGNRTAMTPSGTGTTSYGYDEANRLTAAGSTATYAYDGDGLRAAKTVSGTTTQFAWDVHGNLPLMISDGTADYIYGPDGNIIEQTTGTTPLWYHADQLGSTRALTDTSGTVIATYSYDANGNQTGSTGTATTPFGWTGQYRDAETGFVYLRHRYYDTNTAQFITRDPLAATTRAPLTYANDNPVNEVDPLGLWGWNPISDVTQAASDAGSFVVDHAQTISTVASAVAVLPIPGVDVVAGAIAIGTGGIAAYEQASKGNWTSAALDAVGVFGGVGAFAKAGEAALWASRAEEYWRLGPSAEMLAQDATAAAAAARQWSLGSGLLATAAYGLSDLGVVLPGDQSAAAATVSCGAWG
jgi:RHS repeat-associated protein